MYHKQNRLLFLCKSKGKSEIGAEGEFTSKKRGVAFDIFSKFSRMVTFQIYLLELEFVDWENISKKLNSHENLSHRIISKFFTRIDFRG